MKYIVIVPDGMADRPLSKLGGKTPLMVAFKPNINRLASQGVLGIVRTIPHGMHPGSDIANLSIFGFDPRNYYTGRAPLEAASIGIRLEESDVAYRCNLITLQFNKDMTRALIDDYSAGHISTEEARQLINSIDSELGNDKIRFYSGVSYRHLMVWKGGSEKCECTPPHDIIGKEITDYLPVGDCADVLRDLMLRSVNILQSHAVNKNRILNNKKPANSIWLWGQGKRPSLPDFKELTGLMGALISAVDLTKGIGIYAGLKIINVPGATGYIDTNYQGKAEYAIEALENMDFVYVHIEAPDETSHEGDIEKKIKAIEDIDSLFLGTLLRMLQTFDEYRILLLPDHATPISVKTHTDEPVPFLIYDSRKRQKNEIPYDESLCNRDDVLRIEEGHTLMGKFLRKEI